MNRTLRTVVLAVFTVIAFSVSAAAVVHAVMPDAAPVIADASEYFLRLENNEIIIYKNGESVKTGVSVNSLRQQDRELLEDGISADTYEDVLKLIEDFNS